MSKYQNEVEAETSVQYVDTVQIGLETTKKSPSLKCQLGIKELCLKLLEILPGPACSGARGPPDPAKPPPGAEGLRMIGAIKDLRRNEVSPLKNSSISHQDLQ
ncbi:Leucine-Rich Repeat And Transmembrane Domain-Containing Protein 2 [Manis pentadactyla]|nr:Leucine-Rich Repeat And Transmembrane Domain-Containing Protein 2 [Manis pentadactyla]